MSAANTPLAEISGGPALALPHTTLSGALEAASRGEGALFVARGDDEPPALRYRELMVSALHVAHVLRSRGHQPGEPVLLMLPTSEAWLAAFFGIVFAGGVAVPLGPTFTFGGMERHAATIRHIANDAGAHILIAGKTFAPHLPMLREGSSLRELLLGESLLAESVSPANRAPLPSCSASAPAVFQYTSGTTGTPKGVVLTHGALLANARMIGDRIGASDGDVGVSWLPLFHDMGLVGALMTSLAFGSSLTLLPPESFLLHPRRWLGWVSRRRATLTVGPNFAYQMVSQRVADHHLAGLDLSALRYAFNGAEPVAPSTLRAFEARHVERGLRADALAPVYGMAENTLAATFPARGARWRTRHWAHAQGAAPREITSVGVPLAGISIRVARSDGSTARRGEEGEIRLASPSRMVGYHNRPEATAAALDGEMLRTGDLGFIDDEGELFVTGRAKELIIKRGTNVYPQDLEAIACDVGRSVVTRAAAFGVPSDANGTDDVVIVYEAASMTAHEAERLERDIRGAVIATLGVTVDTLCRVPPRSLELTTSGKLRRTTTRDRYLRGELGGGQP